MEEARCCGTCIYNNYDRMEEEWECICAESEAYGLFTEYDDGCDEWKEGKSC